MFCFYQYSLYICKEKISSLRGRSPKQSSWFASGFTLAMTDTTERNNSDNQ